MEEVPADVVAAAAAREVYTAPVGPELGVVVGVSVAPAVPAASFSFSFQYLQQAVEDVASR